MKKFGTTLAILGVLALIRAFSMDVSVESGYGRVNNIGLMADRSNLMFVGVFLLAIGAGITSKAVSGKNKEENGEEVVGYRKCPYCAETIRSDAKLCKHCKSAVMPVVPDVPNVPDVEKAPEIKESHETMPSVTESVTEVKADSVLDTSKLNKELIIEINSTRPIEEVRSILVDEIVRRDSRFDKEQLMYKIGKFVYMDSKILRHSDEVVVVVLRYNESTPLWLAGQAFMYVSLFFYSVAKESGIAFFGMLALGIFSFVMRNKISTKEARKILDATKILAESH